MNILLLLALMISYGGMLWEVRGVNRLYLIIAAWLLFPNYGTNIIGIFGIPPFQFLELMGASLLAAAAWNEESWRWRMDSLEKIVVAVLLGTVLLQHLIFSPIVESWGWTTEPIDNSAFFKGFMSDLSAVLVLFGCFVYVQSSKELETILKIFIAFSILLFFEYLLDVWDVMPATLKAFSLNPQQRLDSLFLNDFTAVSLVCAVAAVGAFHWFMSTRSTLIGAVFLMASYLTLMNAQRAALLGIVLATLVYLVSIAARRISLRIFSFAAAIILLTIIAPIVSQVASSFAASEQLERRLKQYDRYDSVLARIGIQARTLEIVGAVFPLGVGSGMLRYYQSGPVPATSYYENPAIAEGYERVTNGRAPTEAHNAFVENVADYGILGLVCMTLIIGLVVRNIAATREPIGSAAHREFHAVNSFVILFAVYYLFTSYPKIYIVYFPVLAASSALRRTHLVQRDGKPAMETAASPAKSILPAIP